MKITVDRAKCMGVGHCEASAPAVFEIDDEGGLAIASENVTADQLGEVRAAVVGCPTQALTLSEE